MYRLYRSRIWSAIRLYNVCDERYRDCIRLLRDCRVPGTATYGSIRILIWYWYGAFFGSISPILAVDLLSDMGRTMLNVSGSMTNAIVVDRLQGTFDQEAFNDTKNNSIRYK